MGRGKILLSIGSMLLVVLGAAPAALAEALIRQEIAIPATFPGLFGSNQLKLEALVLRPDDGARHPLAVISHGSPRDRAERRNKSPYDQYSQAQEFARRGFAVVLPMRRGYGNSEDDNTETLGKCKDQVYTDGGYHSATDLREAIRYMVAQPYIDPARILAVGVSAGGLATVALTADPPPGLVAAISFAGGRGSKGPDEVCNPPGLVDAFRSYGKRSRVPMLWVYAENDHYFGPSLARQMHQAFTAGGGVADFRMLPPFEEDGHTLFSRRGIPLWVPLVNEFLAARNLKLRPKPFEIAVPAVPPPSQLSDNGKAEFQKYLAAAPHKAFAVSAQGAFSWRSGNRKTEEAAQEALENCSKFAKGNPCSVVMRDDQPVR